MFFMKKTRLKKLQIWDYQRKLLGILLVFLRFPRSFYALMKIARFFMPKEETPFNSSFRHSFSMLGGGTVFPEDLKAMRLIYSNYKKHMEDLLSFEESDKPVIWAEFNLSNELLRAFDVIPYIPESLSIMSHHLGSEIAVSLIEEAEMAGLPLEYCSAGKSAIGSLLLEQAPTPDILISSSHPCDSVVSSYQALQHMTKASLFSVDIPYWDSEES